MDFELTEDQLELQRVVREIADRECPPSLVRAVVDGTEDGADLWKTFVSLDWPGLTVPEADGGMGWGEIELAIVLEELGRVADPTPFLATASQHLPVVLEAMIGEARSELLAAVGAGSPGAAAFAADHVQAERSGEGWVLHGAAPHVVDGDRALHLAVVAATPDGPGVFAVPAADAVVTRATTFDASLHVAEVALEGVTVPAGRAFTGAEVATAAERAHDVALMGMAAMTVGASQRIFDLALAHVRDRKQFGVPIGSFQALKHMAVDVYVAIERARALVQFAALVTVEGDPRRAVAAAMAKAAAGDAQRIAIAHGIQFFGGLGYTWENDLQLYVRRAKVGELLLGGAAQHRAAVARAALAANEAGVPA